MDFANGNRIKQECPHNNPIKFSTQAKSFLSRPQISVPIADALTGIDRVSSGRPWSVTR